MACLSPSHSKAEQPKSLPARDIARAQGAGEHGELSPSSWQPGRRQRERGQQQGGVGVCRQQHAHAGARVPIGSSTATRVPAQPRVPKPWAARGERGDPLKGVPKGIWRQQHLHGDGWTDGHGAGVWSLVNACSARALLGP